MLSEDYIFRQIAQAMAVIARVLGLVKSGQFQEAQVQVDGAIEGLVGLDANIVKAMDDAGILSLLTSFQQVDLGKLFVLASLFELEGDLFAAKSNRAACRFSYERALSLYQQVLDNGLGSLETDANAKIAELQQKLADVP